MTTRRMRIASTFALGVFGDSQCLVGLHRPGGGERVDGVGLAVAAGPPVGPVDLDHDQALLAHPAGQSGHQLSPAAAADRDTEAFVTGAGQTQPAATATN
jgi:hypothetical protein